MRRFEDPYGVCPSAFLFYWVALKRDHRFFNCFDRKPTRLGLFSKGTHRLFGRLEEKPQRETHLLEFQHFLAGATLPFINGSYSALQPTARCYFPAGQLYNCEAIRNPQES